MKEIIVNGSTILPSTENISEAPTDFELIQVIEVSDTRTTDQTSIQYQEGDVLEIQFEDGTTWITPATKVQDVFVRNNRNVQASVYTIPKSLTIETEDRGLYEILVKTVKYFKSNFPVAITDKAKRELGVKLDNFLMQKEGLFSVKQKDSDSFRESESIFKLGDTNFSTKEKPYLLFLHGFISNFDDAFEDIITATIPNLESTQARPTILATSIISEYGDRILAYNHKTVSKSPIQNTLELLAQIDAGTQLDILAHSRGGLIADLLSMCDRGNSPKFTEEDFDMLYGEEKKLLKELSRLAEEKKIKVRKVIRAGSPMNGTYLLTNHLDQFLSAVFALIDLSTSHTTWTKSIYSELKNFAMNAIGSKADAATFPGIMAMVPNSPFLKMLNDKSRELNIQLFTIEGNSEIGKNIITSFFVILSNLIYRQANDFIVNTSSMRFGTIRSGGAYVFKTEDNKTTHFLYFSHPDICNAIFEALKWNPENNEDQKPPEYFEKLSRNDLIAQFQDRFESSRGGDESLQEDEIIVDSTIKPVDLLDLLYEDSSDVDQVQVESIKITLTHGNLIFAEYPVMSGHFKSEGIVSAEKVIDNNLDNALTDHFFFGNYPEEPKDNIVIYKDEQKGLKGCLLIGLGDSFNFTEFHLRKAVEHGIIAYALHIRNNLENISRDYKKSISSLCVGSGFAGLTMDTALTAILFGITNANLKIGQFNTQLIEKNRGVSLDINKFLTPITKLELIELFEHKAREAFYSLKRIKKLNYTLKIDVPDKIHSFHGGQRQMHTNYTQSWWYDLITKKEASPDSNNEKMSFLSSKGTAKVDESVDFYSVKLVSKLLKSYSKKRKYDKDLSNSLFQLLIPKKIRSILRGQHNIIWKLDKQIASIPWEMLHDSNSDLDPIFVNCGLVRQLISSKALPLDKITRESKALIIGDPKYVKYNQLIGAQREAKLLHEKLEADPTWRVNLLLNEDLITNSLALLNTRYRLLHICGHGVYDPLTQKAGIVMEDTTLDTVFFNNLDNIPELAFINCCFSGTTDKDFEELYKYRYDIAASIGTQLIEMGVEAVVVTGWAVDDKAALEFANIFYDEMFAGSIFGEATKRARRRVYDKYPNNKTWAAYQCYGNPWYQLTKRNYGWSSDVSFNTINEVKVRLYNLRKQIINKDSAEYIFGQTRAILNFVEKRWPQETKIYEKIANIFIDLDHLDLAIEVMEDLLNMPDAQYNVSFYEKYVNAKTTHCIKVSTDLTINPNQDLEAEDFDNLVVGIKKKLDGLLEIGISSERLCHYGKFAKRLTLCNYKNTRDLHLVDVISHYGRAYKILEEGNLLELIYPLVMHLQANYFTEDKFRKIEFRGEKYKIYDLLNYLAEEVGKIPSEKNHFWNDIALINVLTTKMIYTNESHKIHDYKDQITELYSAEFERSGTYRNLRAEIDQFEFLSVLIQVKQQASTTTKTPYFRALVNKLNAVNMILKQLNKLKRK